jgi:hypothetical protein
MRKILFLGFLIFLALPLISANTYGAETYGCGSYGIGCSAASPVSPGGGGGSGGSSATIKFDIKILTFESPVNLGESFNFDYFVKGIGNINNDVTIDFWIEKVDEEITSGSDVIFMGNNEEKTESASLFMPTGLESGIYQFKIKVSLGSIKAEAHRTIELIVKDDKATIDSLFDIRFSLDDSILTSSDELSAVIIFENFGVEATWVNLTFLILDEEGNKIYREEDRILVETEKILRKSFGGLNLDAGKYTILLQTLYGDNVEDEFQQDFEIRGKIRLIWYLIGIMLICLIIWIIILTIKLKRKKWETFNLKHY